MVKKHTPYIGVTGFKTIEQVEAITSFLRKDDPFNNTPYGVMFGFTCSNKRLADPELMAILFEIDSVNNCATIIYTNLVRGHNVDRRVFSKI